MFDDSDYTLHRNFGKDYSNAVRRAQAMQRNAEAVFYVLPAWGGKRSIARQKKRATQPPPTLAR
jgi:hypothetical protein